MNIRVIAWTILLALALFIPRVADARSGCCSHHGGVCGCGCCDGTGLSSTCAPYYPGCGGDGSNTYVAPVRPTAVPTARSVVTRIPSKIPTQIPLGRPTTAIFPANESASLITETVKIKTEPDATPLIKNSSGNFILDFFRWLVGDK